MKSPPETEAGIETQRRLASVVKSSFPARLHWQAEGRHYNPPKHVVWIFVRSGRQDRRSGRDRNGVQTASDVDADRLQWPWNRN
jgi:hypothetical protein